MSIIKGRGGKREGAGRKPTGINTKLIRVHKDTPDINDLLQLWELVKTYRDDLNSDPKAKTSPRWDKMREFLSEVSENLLGK